MKNYGQSGVGSTLEFGKNGTQIKNEASDQMAVYQNNLSDLSRMKGADPVDAQDFVTKAYLERQADVVATGNFETGSETGSYNGQIFVVSKTGLTAPLDVLGSIHRWNSTTSAWEAITMVDGIRIAVNDTITGTDLTLEQGHLYIWDLDLNPTSGWVDIGPAATEQNIYKAVTASFDFNDQGGAVSIGTIPAGAVIDEMLIQVDTAFDGTAPLLSISLATDGLIMADTLSDAEEAGLYQADSFVNSSASQAVSINVAGTGATQGAGRVIVKFKK